MLLALTLLSGCDRPLSLEEAGEALDAFVLAARADAMTTGVVELTTDFTIGQAVEDSARNLRDFVASQLPCSTVTVEGATVTMDFGDLEDACTWQGATYAGVARVTLDAVGDRVQVHHAWEGLTDGTATLDGEADVTWDPAAGTREVVHTAAWTSEGRTVEGEGARVQSLVDAEEGVSAGVRIEGSRAWTVDGARWELGIDGIEARPQDPVPQAGTLTITTPADKVATLTFVRQDADTIRVTLDGARRPYVVDVTGAVVTPVEDGEASTR